MLCLPAQLPPEMEPGLIHVEVQKGAFLGEALPVLVMREGPAREQVCRVTYAQHLSPRVTPLRSLQPLLHGAFTLSDREVCACEVLHGCGVQAEKHRVDDTAMHACFD